jgi:hypothetical protein
LLFSRINYNNQAHISIEKEQFFPLNGILVTSYGVEEIITISRAYQQVIIISSATFRHACSVRDRRREAISTAGVSFRRPILVHHGKRRDFLGHGLLPQRKCEMKNITIGFRFLLRRQGPSRTQPPHAPSSTFLCVTSS